MLEGVEKRFTDSITKIVKEIDKSHLRRMQGDMHRCAATCCDNDTYSMEETAACIENCGNKFNKAQAYVQGEFDRVVNRTQRCVEDCADKVRDKMTPDPTYHDKEMMSNEHKVCLTKCVDSQCDFLLTLEKTMKSVLSSRGYQ